MVLPEAAILDNSGVVRGYPTIALFPDGRKDDIQLYVPWKPHKVTKEKNLRAFREGKHLQNEFAYICFRNAVGRIKNPCGV